MDVEELGKSTPTSENITLRQYSHFSWKRPRRSPMRAVIRELIETAILALLIFLALQFSVQHFRVEGSSMEPTLEDGQYLLVNKLVYLRLSVQDFVNLIPFVDVEGGEPLFTFHPPRRGEVIIFRFPRDLSRDFVKRVIGVAGDTVEIRRGRVFIDDIELDDDAYVTNRGGGSMASVTVPAGSVFVLGDNRRASHDSRDWGPVSDEHVIGRGWVSYWPVDRLHVLRAFNLP